MNADNKDRANIDEATPHRGAWQKGRARVHEIVEGTRARDPASRAFQWFIIWLILLNVLAVVLSTVEGLHQQYGGLFRWLELLSVAVFTVEYVLRVWSCVEDERFERPVLGRLRFIVTPAALIDLLAILPFFLRFGLADFRAIRSLRLFRLFRLLKLGRYSSSVTILTEVLKDKREQILLSLLAVFVLLILASSVMYYVERDVQPEHFGSIPMSMWWGVITLTTVGYGNVFPVTTVGQVIGGIICLLGIGLFALPAGILSSGFQEAIEKKQKLQNEDEGKEASGGKATPEDERRYCPCCGRRLEDEGEPEVAGEA